MEVEQVLEQARAARATGATRFCMGAAWRSPKNRDMPYVVAMVKGVRELGLESCMTLGMLTDEQARNWPRRGWITTTTTWTPRRSFTATSSPPAPTRIVWILWIMCAMRA